MQEKKKMRWWVVLLIVFGAFMFVTGVAVVGAVWWFRSNKDRLIGEMQEIHAEAEAFARDHDQNACIDEGLRRFDGCLGFTCEVRIGTFTRACLERAQPTPSLCDGVPPRNEFVKVAGWVETQCQHRGKRDNPRCQRLLQAVPEICERRSTPRP